MKAAFSRGFFHACLKGAVCSTAATAERLRRLFLAPEPSTAAGIAGEGSFSGEMMGNDGKNHRNMVVLWWFYGINGNLLHCYGTWPCIVSFMMVYDGFMGFTAW